MSKNNNVNPAHYKVGGRERQGEDIVHEIEKQKIAQQRAGISNVSGAFGREPGNRHRAQEASSHPSKQARGG